MATAGGARLRIKPLIHFILAKLPKPADLAGGKSMTGDPLVDGIPPHSKEDGDFIDRQEAIRHGQGLEMTLLRFKGLSAIHADSIGQERFCRVQLFGPSLPR